MPTQDDTAYHRAADHRAAHHRTPVPWWLPVPAVVGGLFVVVPVLAMVGRVDWTSFVALVTSPASTTALGLSLGTAAAATGVAFVLGYPLAVLFARSTSRWVGVLRALVLLPLVLPPVVGGLALLAVFGRLGVLGALLDEHGLRIAFTTTAVVMAQVFVSMPFLVSSIEGSLRTGGDRAERIAATLGAGPTRTFLTVTTPRVLPGITAGLVLCGARALGEFGATLTFAGSLQGVTRTLPLEVYLQREVDPDTAVALALVLVVVALVVIGTTTLRTRPVVA
ncbi:ABC transporter permease [Curtobacterium caseinilyticum]|uniref:Molybdenum transport system permease n=1 Tax=Curtobacterium caseinilyticum TaxID=3055137 RepID=A0ABT7TM46_9MICO|nr:ABC transporter permease [Curtobacterium caseinilyticum]MDM7890646.1 ABC transporter permease [Curtobacterium caseinilyticum]